MKIIHCSDLHLDARMTTHLSEAKAQERKKEILLTFDRLVDYAAKNDVKAIIIAGDMFDTARVSMATKNRIFSLISKNKGINFYYLAGNHDEENIISSLENPPENLFVFSNKWTSYSLGDVVITGVRLTGENPAIYDLLSLDKDKKNIVVLHGEKASHNLKEVKEVVNFAKLKNKGIDYLALGHYHTFDEGELDKRGKWCYSGCLEGRGFDECGEKGFVLLDVNEEVTSSFVPFATRKLHEIECDITGIDEFYEIEKKALKLCQDIDQQDFVRVILVGKYNLNLNKDLKILEKKLCNYYYFGQVVDKSVLNFNAADFENDISLRGEFIRQVQNSNLKQEEKDNIILLGLKVLNGEEVDS